MYWKISLSSILHYYRYLYIIRNTDESVMVFYEYFDFFLQNTNEEIINFDIRMTLLSLEIIIISRSKWKPMQWQWWRIVSSYHRFVCCPYFCRKCSKLHLLEKTKQYVNKSIKIKEVNVIKFKIDGFIMVKKKNNIK